MNMLESTPKAEVGEEGRNRMKSFFSDVRYWGASMHVHLLNACATLRGQTAAVVAATAGATPGLGACALLLEWGVSREHGTGGSSKQVI
jgi:hypothetical protein